MLRRPHRQRQTQRQRQVLELVRKMRAGFGTARLALAVWVGACLVAAPGVQAWVALPACCRTACIHGACPIPASALRAQQSAKAKSEAATEAVELEDSASCHDVDVPVIVAESPRHTSEAIAERRASTKHAHHYAAQPKHHSHGAVRSGADGSTANPTPSILSAMPRCPTSADPAPAPAATSIEITSVASNAERPAPVLSATLFMASQPCGSVELAARSPRSFAPDPSLSRRPCALAESPGSGALSSAPGLVAWLPRRCVASARSCRSARWRIAATKTHRGRCA